MQIEQKSSALSVLDIHKLESRTLYMYMCIGRFSRSILWPLHDMLIFKIKYQTGAKQILLMSSKIHWYGTMDKISNEGERCTEWLLKADTVPASPYLFPFFSILCPSSVSGRWSATWSWPRAVTRSWSRSVTIVFFCYMIFRKLQLRRHQFN